MPICYLHAGTHKTGTTAIQRMLALNEELLREAGIYVPRTGRIFPDFASHHSIAWELNESPKFHAAQGTLAEMIAEVERSGAQTIVVSSEDFEQLYRKPEKISTFVRAFEAIGFSVKPLVYLRPQAEYFEAIYADAIRSGAIFRFQWLMGDVITTGAYCTLSNDALAFDYSKLLDGFASAAGARNVIARRYAKKNDAAWIVRDFLRTISAPSARVPLERVSVPPRLNVSLSFGDLLRQISRNREAHGFEPLHVPTGSIFDYRLDFLQYEEARAFLQRFRLDSRIVARKYGARVPPVGAREFARDVRAKLGFDRGSRLRRAALDALDPWLHFMPGLE